MTSQGMDFAVDAELAHAARDELGVLGAEVEDQDARGVDVGLWTRRTRRSAIGSLRTTR